ncbi:hypothetical protein Tco_0868487 [Tanacetum coccineum]
MTILAEFMIVAGAENRPPMLDKVMYYSWKSRMFLYIKGKKNGRMMLESIENEPLVYPTVEEEVQIQKKKYAELTKQKWLQDVCDVQERNIVLQGLPPDVYALVNHCQSAKGIWERVKLLMKGTELSYQERECKLYNEFDKFTLVKGETLHEYYLRFAQLINDMHTISMTIQQVQVNTKFLNALPPEWSKFVTDVKLAKNMYTTNYDQLYAYLSQHEGHVNEVRMMHERYTDPLALTQLNHTPTSVPQNAYHTPSITQQPQAEFPQLDSGLAVLVFLPGDDPIACLNKAMAFTVTVQQVQGRQGQSFAGMRTKGNDTSSGGNNATAWFKEKLMLAEAQESGQVLDEEQLAFLVDHGIAYCHDIQQTIIHDAAF